MRSNDNLQGGRSSLEGLTRSLIVDKRLLTIVTKLSKESLLENKDLDDLDESVTESVWIDKIDDASKSDSSGYSGKGGGAA